MRKVESLAQYQAFKVCKTAGCGKTPFGMHLGSEYCRRHLQQLRQADLCEAPTPDRTRPERSGWVYFVKSLIEHGPVKIGYSRTPDIRIQDLRVASSYPLQLAAVWRSKDARALESKLHRKFRAHKMNGEWFKPSPDLIKLVELLSAGKYLEAGQMII